MNLGETKEQEENGMTEDKMVGWHHRLNGHGFWWTLGVGDGQGGLARCDSRGSQRVRHDWMTEINWTELNLPKTSWYSVISSSVVDSLCNSSTVKLKKAGCPQWVVFSTFSFMVSHISFFRESHSLCTLNLVCLISSVLLSCPNTIKIRSKVAKENR